jgi:hypothetical protein
MFDFQEKYTYLPDCRDNSRIVLGAYGWVGTGEEKAEDIFMIPLKTGQVPESSSA